MKLTTARLYGFLTLGVICTAFFVCGCASVSVRKVPTPTQYMEWTDQMQHKADAMQGIRYYMPRPFVNVFESFPIRTDIYLAQGVISPDGRYVVLTDIVPEAALTATPSSASTLPITAISEAQKYSVPIQYISDGATGFDSTDTNKNVMGVPEGQNAAGLLGTAVGREFLLRVLSGTDAPIEASGSGVAESTIADVLKSVIEKQQAKKPAPPTTLQQKLAPGTATGVLNLKARNDNSLYAYQPMRGNLDIAYLPDFDEQYVVSGTANLGNANVALYLGQSWSLQGLDAVADNTELNRRIFDLIDTAVQIAKTAALKGLNFVQPEATGQAAAGVISADKGASLLDAGPKPGTPVTLKFVVIHYAAKGLYPILKPRELQPRYWAKDQRFGHRYGRHYCVLDLFKVFPQRTPASMVGLDFSPETSCHQPGQRTVGRAGQIGQSGTFKGSAPGGIENINPEPPTDLSGHWLNLLSGQTTIPVYPYQYISFNTFRYVAIEAIQATTTGNGPFKYPYSATGTDNESGNTRTEISVLDPSARPKIDGRPSATDVKSRIEGTTFHANGGDLNDPVPWSYKVSMDTFVPSSKLVCTVSSVPQPTEEDDRTNPPDKTRMEKEFPKQALAVLTNIGINDMRADQIGLTVPDKFAPPAEVPESDEGATQSEETDTQ